MWLWVQKFSWNKEKKLSRKKEAKATKLRLQGVSIEKNEIK